MLATGADSKGAFVLLQLPLALQASLLQALGLGWLLERLSWSTAYVILGIPTLVLLYFVGKFPGKCLAWARA
jgi:hypothetical protein